MRPYVLVVILAIITGVQTSRAQTPGPVSEEWVQKWREDLETAVTQLERVHADLYHTVTRTQFRQAINSLQDRLPGMSHSEIVVELARIMALIGDGHTRLTLPLADGVEFFTGHANTPPPLIPGPGFRQYPLRLFLYDDGVYVQQAGAGHAGLAGKRLVGIGGLAIDDVMAAVQPTIRHDNNQQIRQLMPEWLVIPEILQARGVIRDMDRARYVLEDPDKKRQEVILKPVPPGRSVTWIDGRANTAARLANKHPGVNYWFEHLPARRAVYVRYAEAVVQEDHETIEQFAKRLYQFVDANPVERVIFDIRGNVGGNGENNRPLLHGAIRSDKLRKPGSLIALIDRGTFSAALMFARDLEEHTPVVFAGETMGAKPNHYGDSRMIRLPQTGLTIRAATRYWQLGGPTDQRNAMEPMIKVPVLWTNDAIGQDLALETVLDYQPAAGQAEGKWDGVVNARGHFYHMALEIINDDGNRWSATLSIPELKVADLPLRDVAIHGDTCNFTWAMPTGNIAFAIQADPKRMLGFGFDTGFFYPVALRRLAPGELSGNGNR